MADEYSYFAELTALVSTLALGRCVGLQVMDDTDLTDEELEKLCIFFAGGAHAFRDALDEQRQAMSDAVPPRE